MCKKMMEQRNRIKSMLNKDLERCLKNIRQNGGHDAPTVMVDMEKLFIANREYFEHQGFFFERANRIEKKQVKYYARLKLGCGDGELAREYWKRIREAKEEFMKAQRHKILEDLKKSKDEGVWVDMKSLLFENKIFFEEQGFFFETGIMLENDKNQYLACMRQRH